MAKILFFVWGSSIYCIYCTVYTTGVPVVGVEPPVRACGKLAPEMSGIKIRLRYVSLI